MKPPIIKTLKNGLKICLLPNSQVESVTVQLSGVAGSSLETKREIGAAHFLEHWILNESKIDLITKHGCKYVGITSRDDVLFGVHVLKDNLQDTLVFLSEIFYRPILDASAIYSLKNTVKNEVARIFDSPEKLISRLAYATLFDAPRMKVFNTGGVEDIDKLKPAAIEGFYKKYYTPNRFVLTVCGNFSVKKVYKQIGLLYGQKVRKSGTISEKKFAITKLQKYVTHVLSQISQNYIRIDYPGFKISDENKYAALVLAKILDSRLKSQAQKNGLAYKTSVTSFNARNYGIFIFYGVVSPDKLKEFIKVCAELTKSQIDMDTVESAKNSVLANFIFSLEKTSMLAGYYSELILHGTKKQNHIYEIAQIKKINLKRLNLIAHYTFKQKPKATLLSKDQLLTKPDTKS